jgi:nucleotide-binding universal stress UspA family protein
MKTEQLIWFIDSRFFYKNTSLDKIVRLANIHHKQIKVIIDASAQLTGRGYWHLFDDTDTLSHEVIVELDKKQAQLQKFFTMNAIKANVIVNQSTDYLQIINSEIEQNTDCVLVIEDAMTTKRHPIFQEFKELKATILLLTHKLWKSSINILAAVDPLHEHARPDELDENIVSLTKGWATSLKSSWVIVHCCYIASVLSKYKSKLIAMHREGFSAFAMKNRLPDEQCVLLEGIPEDALSCYAVKHHVDIIVIGLVARNRLEQFWVGSTTSALLYSPPCDLLLIKKQHS